MISRRVCFQPSAGALGAEHGGEAAQIAGDLRSQQSAMLIAALVRFAFDVQDDPAGLRKAIGRAIALHRRGIGLIVGSRRSVGVSTGPGENNNDK